MLPPGAVALTNLSLEKRYWLPSLGGGLVSDNRLYVAYDLMSRTVRRAGAIRGETRRQHEALHSGPGSGRVHARIGDKRRGAPRCARLQWALCSQFVFRRLWGVSPLHAADQCFFCKKLGNLKAALARHFAHYNLVLTTQRRMVSGSLLAPVPDAAPD